jgi:hypothetical protein
MVAEQIIALAKAGERALSELGHSTVSGSPNLSPTPAAPRR